MAVLRFDSSLLRVELTRVEHVLGLLGDLEVPIDSVTSAEVVPATRGPLTGAMAADGRRAIRGWRAPGLSVPGRSKVGTWRDRGDKWFVAVHREEPAVRVVLEGQRWAGLVVSTPEAAAVVSRLNNSTAG